MTTPLKALIQERLRAKIVRQDEGFEDGTTADVPYTVDAKPLIDATEYMVPPPSKPLKSSRGRTSSSSSSSRSATFYDDHGDNNRAYRDDYQPRTHPYGAYDDELPRSPHYSRGGGMLADLDNRPAVAPRAGRRSARRQPSPRKTHHDVSYSTSWHRDESLEAAMRTRFVASPKDERRRFGKDADQAPSRRAWDEPAALPAYYYEAGFDPMESTTVHRAHDPQLSDHYQTLRRSDSRSIATDDLEDDDSYASSFDHPTDKTWSYADHTDNQADDIYTKFDRLYDKTDSRSPGATRHPSPSSRRVFHRSASFDIAPSTTTDLTQCDVPERPRSGPIFPSQLDVAPEESGGPTQKLARIRALDEILSPGSQLAAQEFVEKRQKRGSQGTPRTMATHRWLQSMLDAAPTEHVFTTPSPALATRHGTPTSTRTEGGFDFPSPLRIAPASRSMAL